MACPNWKHLSKGYDYRDATKCPLWKDLLVRCILSYIFFQIYFVLDSAYWSNRFSRRLFPLFLCDSISHFNPSNWSPSAAFKSSAWWCRTYRNVYINCLIFKSECCAFYVSYIWDSETNGIYTYLITVKFWKHSDWIFVWYKQVLLYCLCWLRWIYMFTYSLPAVSWDKV